MCWDVERKIIKTVRLARLELKFRRNMASMTLKITSNKWIKRIYSCLKIELIKLTPGERSTTKSNSTFNPKTVEN